MFRSNDKQPERSVLLIGNFFVSKGGRQVSQDLAERLTEHGWQVFTSSKYKGRLLRLLGMLWVVLQRSPRYKVAHIDVFSGPSFIWAELVGYLLTTLGKPFIITLHGGNLPTFAKHHSRRVKNLLDQAKIVISPSTYLQTELSLFHSSITLLPNPIEITRYQFQQRHKAEPKVLWLRTFRNDYNPLLAADAIYTLLNEYPMIHLFMIGPDKSDGSYETFKHRVHKLRLEQHVTIIPGIAKSEVPTWLQRADIFINTSNVDNTPVSVIEAMACGLPVVSTSVGGMPYLITNRENGLLVPPNDPIAMAEAIKEIIEKPELASKLSSNGRRTTEAFDWNAVLPKWDELLLSAQEKTK